MLTDVMMTVAAFASIVVPPTILGGTGDTKALPIRPPEPFRPALRFGDKDYCVVLFSEDAYALSETALDTLQRGWEEVQGDATLREILVVAYADSDYPRDGRGSLSRQACMLASRRGAIVKRYLQDLGARQVAVFNMAKRPNWLQDWLLTADALLKHEVVGDSSGSGGADLFYHEVGRFLEAEGGPGKVFVVMRKDMLYAH